MLGVSQRVMMGASGAPGGPPEITVNAVEFDGTNDYLSRGAGYTGAVDGDKGSIVSWVKFSGGDTTSQILFHQSQAGRDPVVLERKADGKLTLGLQNSVPAILLVVTTDVTLRVADGWQCVMISWDTGPALEAMIYFGDTAIALTVATQVEGTIDYTTDEAAVGAFDAGGSKLDACLSQVYFNSAEFIDFTVESNRRKFFSAGGKPVDLGADGSDPTGTAPILFLSGPTVNWHTNLGSGNGMTENGALTDCASSPSD